MELNFGNPSGYQPLEQLIPQTAQQQLFATAQQSPLGAVPEAGNSGFWSLDSFLGNAQNGTNGWGMPALNAASTLLNGWFGLEQLDMAKAQLAENKRQFNLNFGNQARLTNARLTDRQNRRVEEGRATESAESYVSKYGVRGY